MFKVLVSIITILLCAISSKLVQCYTAIVGFVFMLLSVLFPSLSKQSYSKCISLDNSELEILQKQISSSSETFPVSIESSFSSHIALDVIESQNQRYQDYMKFKVQMKKKQNKHSSQSVIDQSESSNLQSNNINAQLSYSEDATQAYFDELSNNYANQCSDCENLNNSIDQFQTPITPKQLLNPNLNNIYLNSSYGATQTYFNDLSNDDENNQIIEQSTCDENDFLSENNSYPEQSEEVEQEEEINECSTDASFDSQDSNLSIEQCQNFQQQENTREYQMYSVKKNMHSQEKLELSATRMNNHSTDENIESLNKQVMKEHLHNYFNMEYIQAKRLVMGERTNIHDYLENFCSRKRCPCLKFKRRYQRVRQVQANKKKLPIIFENFGY